MTNKTVYITTSIPYVNARPHVGHALEFVQADALVRHRRLRGDSVRSLTGTDDNALKNVQAARANNQDVGSFVNANADAFHDLVSILDLSVDDFIRTSTDARHVPSVHELWRRCDAAGDLYGRDYEGKYCVGCEQFVSDDELVDGRCSDHGTEPESVNERNYFFRLSRYERDLLEVLESGRVRVEPAGRRNEVLSFIRAGLDDFSVSRSAERAHGWGIRVPGDDAQVVYVWFDALQNYLSALDFGADDTLKTQWWDQSDERIHVIGKGIIRFHAVYWLAILLSAGIELPTKIFVHGYLTSNGKKISKTLGNVVHPSDVVSRYDCDPLRWWLLADVPRIGDADFTVERLVDRWNSDIVGGIGNVTNRVVKLLHLCRNGRVPLESGSNNVAAPLREALANARHEIDNAFDNFDFRSASAVLSAVASKTNRLLDNTRPWELRHSVSNADADLLDEVLAVCTESCRLVSAELAAFVPTTSLVLTTQLTAVDGRLPEARPQCARIESS